MIRQGLREWWSLPLAAFCIVTPLIVTLIALVIGMLWQLGEVIF